MITTIQKNFVYFALALWIVLVILLMNRPVESARRFQYRVLSVTGMTELRTESNADRGQLKTIENLIEQQAAEGWEFYQADGYVLYFRK